MTSTAICKVDHNHSAEGQLVPFVRAIFDMYEVLAALERRRERDEFLARLPFPPEHLETVCKAALEAIATYRVPGVAFEALVLEVDRTITYLSIAPHAPERIEDDDPVVVAVQFRLPNGSFVRVDVE